VIALASDASVVVVASGAASDVVVGLPFNSGGLSEQTCPTQTPDVQSSPLRQASPRPRAVSVHAASIAIGSEKKAKTAIAFLDFDLPMCICCVERRPRIGWWTP
jgi:hypothetical protein